MKSLLSLLLLLLLGISLPSGLHAQIEGEDISPYLDDGGISNSTNILSVNLISWTTGDLTVYYEKTFKGRIGMEVGLGAVLPFYIAEIPGSFDNFPRFGERTTGHSLHLHPKYYFLGEAPEYHYMGPQYRRRQYNYLDADPVIFHDFTMNYGINLLIKDRFVGSLNAGLGCRFQTQDDNGEKSLRIIGLAFPYNFRFGFLF